MFTKADLHNLTKNGIVEFNGRKLKVNNNGQIFRVDVPQDVVKPMTLTEALEYLKVKAVKLKPTEGGYQKVKDVLLVKETKTQYVTCVNGKTWKFSKSDNLRTGSDKNEFPRYQIDI